MSPATLNSGRAYSSDDLSDLLALVSTIARARWPGSAYLMTSDVGWQIGGAAPETNIRLWHDDQGLAGYAWFDEPADVVFDVRPDVGPGSPILREMLDWANARRRELPPHSSAILDCRNMADWERLFLSPQEPTAAEREPQSWLIATAFDRDRERVTLLEAQGFTVTEHFMPYLRRSLDVPIPAPSLPEGARLRHVEEADFDERVAVHGDAWWPASGFTRETYLGVRASPTYDPELDIVLETADGSFASYCIAWLDAEMGVGSFEPVGTRRAFRRHGTARLVTYEGLRRLKERGMHTANIQTAGFNERAVGLYESCGFEHVDTKRSYVRR